MCRFRRHQKGYPVREKGTGRIRTIPLPENKIEEIRSRIARLEDDGETAYHRLARRLVEEDKADPEDKSNSGKTAWDAAIENKAMKIAAFLSGSDPMLTNFGLARQHGHIPGYVHEGYGGTGCHSAFGADLQTVCEHKDMYDFESKSPLACAFSWFDSIQDAPAMILNGGANPELPFPE